MDSRTLKAARWADFEEDSIWHERVGLALLEAGYEVKAIEEFEKAKAQDQANWRADIGLAKALSKSSEKRLQAIDMMEKTLQVLEQNTNWMSDNERLYQKFCLDLAGFYIANADGEKAAGMYHKVWKLSSNDLGLQAVAPLVRLLVRQPNFLEIVEILRAMAEDQADNAEFDRLTEFYHDSSNDIELHRHIATAARKSDSVDFLRESYQKAIGEAEKKSLSIISDYLLFDYAKLLLLDYGEVSRATQILEAVLLMTTTRSIRDSVFYLREEAKTSLCAIYYEQAKLAGIGSQVAKNCIDKLRKLAAPDTDDDSDSDVSQMTNPVQVLGQWLKQEEKDDIGARKIFQRHVKLGIEWLSDSDPYNDEDAYRNLAFAFLYYGDYDNALAAFSLLGPVEPDPDTEASESDGTSDDQPATEDALGADINQDIGDVGAKDVNSEPRDPSTEEALDPPRASLKHSDAEHEGATDVTENSTATGDKADILESGRQMPDDEVTKRTKPGKDEELVPESGTFPPAADNSHLDMDDKAAEESTPIASWETGPILDEMAYKWICDGGCGRVTNFHHDIHFCKSCLLLGFCPECHEQLQSDKLGFRICSSAHHWLDVPKASERLPWGQVRFRGELKPIEEWKADIKKEWGL
jgi:tetratricopeptide (TPR) repeat protein